MKQIERRLMALEQAQTPTEDDRIVMPKGGGFVIVNMQTGVARDLAGQALPSYTPAALSHLVPLVRLQPGYLEALL